MKKLQNTIRGLLYCNAEQWCGSLPTFWTTLLPPTICPNYEVRSGDQFLKDAQCCWFYTCSDADILHDEEYF